MSAIGAVSGNGIYSELEYKGKRFKISQWFNDAMDAVATAAFIKAGRLCQLLGGTEKVMAQREVALARSFSLGAFSFSSVVEDGGLDQDDELLATFLHRLIQPNDENATFLLALEMVKNERPAVVKAINNANPRKERETAEAAPVPTGQASETAGKTSAT